MSPLVVESMIQAAVAMIQAVRNVRQEHPEVKPGAPLRQQLNHQMELLSRDLQDDIQKELDERANVNKGTE